MGAAVDLDNQMITGRLSHVTIAHRAGERVPPNGIGSWDDVFGNRAIGSAILDRLLHHAIPVKVRGNSYRLGDKLTVGLLKPADVPSWGGVRCR